MRERDRTRHCSKRLRSLGRPDAAAVGKSGAKGDGLNAKREDFELEADVDAEPAAEPEPVPDPEPDAEPDAEPERDAEPDAKPEGGAGGGSAPRCATYACRVATIHGTTCCIPVTRYSFSPSSGVAGRLRLRSEANDGSMDKALSPRVASLSFWLGVRGWVSRKR